MTRPSLFVIGDSISCYYGKHLEPMLAGRFAYDRKGGTHTLDNLDDCTNGVNGGDSSMVLAYLTSVVEMDFFHPDYLLLNCGIHDTKPTGDDAQVPLPKYRDNLETILRVAKKHGIRVIWVRTTPVNENTDQCEKTEIQRRKRAIEQYNRAADRIMATAQVPTIDLHQFTLTLGPDIWLNGSDPVHFNDAAARLQASFIAGTLRQQP